MHATSTTPAEAPARRTDAASMETSTMNAHTPAAEFSAITPPPLLEGVSGASPATIAAAEAVEALLVEGNKLSGAHLKIAAQFGSASKKAEDAEAKLSEAWQRFETACGLLLEGTPSPEDKVARVTAYLRARGLSGTREQNWEQQTLLTAIDRVIDSMPSPENDLAPALRFMLEHNPAITHKEADAAEWTAAVAAYEAARVEDANLLAAAHAATAAVEAEAPIPEDLRTSDGGWRFREDSITEAKNIPFMRKVELLEIQREYLARRKIAEERYDPTGADDVWENHPGGWPEFEALMGLTPPTFEALTDKLRLYISEILCTEIGDDVDGVETISRLLSQNRDPTGPWGIARLYQDALHISGQRPDLVAAKPFDVEAWIEAFEAHPGHMICAEGRVNYSEPEAFGTDTPDYHDIMVTEPDAIARFDAYQRSHFSDEQWAQEQAERERKGWPTKREGPFTAQSQNQLDAAYPERGPEHERLSALLALRHERLTNTPPTGAHLWRDLADWQKGEVREYCRANPDQFTSSYKWTPETWMEAFEAAGGAFHPCEGGSFLAGAPVPTPFFAARLMRALDDDLRRSVGDILRAKWESEACDMIEDYEAAGGHICLTFDVETGENTGVCIREQAPPSNRMSQIEAALHSTIFEPHFRACLDNLFRFEAAKLRRGETGLIGRDAIRAHAKALEEGANQ